MASYYVTGYTTPEGVNSREKVKEYQRMLGVSADGVWGPVTQSAYEKSTGDAYSDNINKFNEYYGRIYDSLNVPSISVNTPSRGELEADWSAALRPQVELSIKNRRKRGEEMQAELDADAASRGMGASTYVSSMKEREDDDVEEDVSSMEAQYTATLAERIASALQYYSSLEMQAAGTNAQLAASAGNTAMSAAMQWYQSYLDTLGNTPAFSSAYTSRARSTSSGTNKGNGLTQADCLRYVKLLSASQRKGLFGSNEEYWAARREELVDTLGTDAYERLKRGYAGAKGGGVAEGGSGIWQAKVKY